MVESQFGPDYYERFYRDPKTRVGSVAGTERLARFVCSYVDYLGQPVSRVLDIGCGLGLWRPMLRRHFPKADYLGVERSEHLCREHGFTPGSVVDFAADEPFDLVICQGVLQYLTARQADRAIGNLGRLCRGALYLEVVTERDWREVCDQSRTDPDVYLRSGGWYRMRLSNRRFRPAGGGVFLSERSPALLYELEGTPE